MLAAKLRKKVKHVSLILDLESRGLALTYVTLEIGSLGHSTKSATRNIQILRPDNPPQNGQEIIASGSKKTPPAVLKLSSMLGLTQHGPLLYPCSALQLVLFCLCLFIY